MWFRSWRIVMPFGEGRGIPVEVEQALRDELKDECGDEDLRHAPDAEAVSRP